MGKTVNFSNYRTDIFPLEDMVLRRALALKVADEDWRAIQAMLAPLGAKPKGGVYHRDHSYRVGLLASEIAEAVSVGRRQLQKIAETEDIPYYVDEGLCVDERTKPRWYDPKALFFAGLLHDIGKALVPACTLCATEKWTDEDRKNMEPHVLDGFRMLRDRFDFTAHVIVWHHRFQSSGYPAELPAALQPFSEATLEKAKEYGKLLMVADVFDAMHRINSATGGVALTSEEIKARMLKLHPELLGDLVPRLYEKGVLR
jgi:HD-GYP domain-containing protein (c-di-GMP phosphodiesterase class II)